MRNGCIVLALLAGLSACASEPEGKVVGITFESDLPKSLHRQLWMREGDDGVIKIELELTSTGIFQDRFWIANVFSDDWFCDDTIEGSVGFQGPLFGLDVAAYVGDESWRADTRFHALTDDERASIFMNVKEWPRIRYSVEYRGMSGGRSSDVFDYNGIKQPRDICLQLVSARGLIVSQYRTKTIIVPGEAIKEILLTRQDLGDLGSSLAEDRQLSRRPPWDTCPDKPQETADCPFKPAER